MPGAERKLINPLATNFPSLLSVMSQHKSLQGSSGIVVKRNVLKRFERIDLLKKRGHWKAGDGVQGLRKTKPDV
jgi:small basic protein (TIGR04137 family)